MPSSSSRSSYVRSPLSASPAHAARAESRSPGLRRGRLHAAHRRRRAPVVLDGIYRAATAGPCARTLPAEIVRVPVCGDASRPQRREVMVGEAGLAERGHERACPRGGGPGQRIWRVARRRHGRAARGARRQASPPRARCRPGTHLGARSRGGDGARRRRGGAERGRSLAVARGRCRGSNGDGWRGGRFRAGGRRRRRARARGRRARAVVRLRRRVPGRAHGPAGVQRGGAAGTRLAWLVGAVGPATAGAPGVPRRREPRA